MNSDFYARVAFNPYNIFSETAGNTPIKDFIQYLSDRLNEQGFETRVGEITGQTDYKQNICFLIMPWEDGTKFDSETDGVFPYYGFDYRSEVGVISKCQASFGLVNYDASTQSFTRLTDILSKNLIYGPNLLPGIYRYRPTSSSESRIYFYSNENSYSIYVNNTILFQVRGALVERHNVYDISAFVVDYIGDSASYPFSPRVLIGSFKDTFDNSYKKGIMSFIDNSENPSIRLQIVDNNTIYPYLGGNFQSEYRNSGYKRNNYANLVPLGTNGFIVNELYIAYLHKDDSTIMSLPRLYTCNDNMSIFSDTTITLNGIEYEVSYIVKPETMDCVLFRVKN